MFDALVLQWRVSVDYTEVHIVPHRQSFFRVSTVQDPNKRGTIQVSTRCCFITVLQRSKYSKRMGFEFIFLKFNSFCTGDGAMVTDAQVKYTDLCECIWVVCIYIYIWSISTTDVGVILVGDSVSWVRPSCVIVESQEECGFSKSVLKSPNKRMSAVGFTARRLSIICTKY